MQNLAHSEQYPPSLTYYLYFQPALGASSAAAAAALRRPRRQRLPPPHPIVRCPVATLHSTVYRRLSSLVATNFHHSRRVTCTYLDLSAAWPNLVPSLIRHVAYDSFVPDRPHSSSFTFEMLTNVVGRQYASRPGVFSACALVNRCHWLRSDFRVERLVG